MDIELKNQKEKEKEKENQKQDQHKCNNEIIIIWDHDQHYKNDENNCNSDYKKLSLYTQFPDIINFVLSQYLYCGDWCCIYYDNKFHIFSPINFLFLNSSRMMQLKSQSRLETIEIFNQMKKYSFSFECPHNNNISINHFFKIDNHHANSNLISNSNILHLLGSKDDHRINYSLNLISNQFFSHKPMPIRIGHLCKIPRKFIEQFETVFSQDSFLSKVTADHHRYYIAFSPQLMRIKLYFLNDKFEDEFDGVTKSVSISYPSGLKFPPGSWSWSGKYKIHFFADDLYCFTLHWNQLTCYKFVIHKNVDYHWEVCSPGPSNFFLTEIHGNFNITLSNGRYFLFYGGRIYNNNEDKDAVSKNDDWSNCILFDFVTLTWKLTPWNLPISVLNDKYMQIVVTSNDILVCVIKQSELWILDTQNKNSCWICLKESIGNKCDMGITFKM